MPKSLKMLIFFLFVSIGCLWLGILFLGVRYGIFFGAIVGVSSFFLTKWRAATLLLKAHQAVLLNDREDAELISIIKKLSQRADIISPEAWKVQDQCPYLFSITRGPLPARLLISSGLLECLDSEELEGVLACEVAKIKLGRRSLEQLGSVVIDRILRLTGQYKQLRSQKVELNATRTFLFAALTPPLKILSKLSFNPNLELRTDQLGGQLCGHPEWIANALIKIHKTQFYTPTQRARLGSANLYFLNPFAEFPLLQSINQQPHFKQRLNQIITGGNS